MATAKQIAWRKKFGAMAKAGKFAKNPSVRSPTSTRTRTATKTSTEADTQGNITVTGGAGRGATSVTIRGTPAGRGKSTRKRLPNPLPIVFKVQSRSGDGRSWTTIIRTPFEADAFKTARALHQANPNRAYRVIDTER